MESLKFDELLRPLLRWWWLLAAAALLAGASTFVYTAQQPEIYQSHTTLMIGDTISDPNPNNTQIALSQQLAQVYADIAKRSTIQHATMKALQLEWLPDYDVRVTPNTQMVEITANDVSPERAQAVAAELVNQLILQSPAGHKDQERQGFVNERLDKLETDIVITEDEILLKQQDLADMFSARQIEDTENEIRALQNKLDSLQTSYTTLLASSARGAANTITVVELASLPVQPLRSGQLNSIILAMLLGTSVAAVGAYILESLDRSIRDEHHLERQTELRLLAGIPRIDEKRAAERELQLWNQAPVVQNACRHLRTHLFSLNGGDVKQTILVTSSDMTDAKSIVVANLCLAIATTGKRVILLDADLKRPFQHRLFHLTNRHGFTTLLRDPTMELASLLQNTHIPNLALLPSGPIGENAAELLDSQRMPQLLEELKQLADIIIIDSPPLSVSADTTILSTLVSGTLLVVNKGLTQAHLLTRAIKLLRQVNVPIIGTVLYGLSEKESAHARSSMYGHNLDSSINSKHPIYDLATRWMGSSNGATPRSPKHHQTLFNGKRKRTDAQARTEVNQ